MLKFRIFIVRCAPNLRNLFKAFLLSLRLIRQVHLGVVSIDVLFTSNDVGGDRSSSGRFH